ncbi:aconitate hydratase AcnA [Piscicoccus intestinalis]|uniref:aconitate hydratase AcnA n=1 Tax=Piscicoccus intestinalis TaxID=746033 RepID=UPI000837DB65|nr:aconitate hydratase AcnA [Piscicoccus intestinalis]
MADNRPGRSDSLTRSVRVGDTDYVVADLGAVAQGELARWPMVLRILAENAVRTAGEGRDHALEQLRSAARGQSLGGDIPFLPSRLLMHDTTATPALVDVAAMRDALARRGVDPVALNPTLPIEVSVDHSLAVESFARPDAPQTNMREEIRRNVERYRFLRWAAATLSNLHVNAPGTGIMHTINLEQLATVATTQERDGRTWLVPDVMVGTDSHTPMINGLGVLGWGVGGLEAQTVMFGLPISLRVPDVVGVRLTGSLRPGATATDLALTVTHRLREIGVTGEFVEFYGPGVGTLTVGERAVVANMAPEYGATTGYFPIDAQTVEYLRRTGRPAGHAELVEAYARAAGLWFDAGVEAVGAAKAVEPVYTRTIDIDLSALRASAAGPRRPQDLRELSQVPAAVRAVDGAGEPTGSGSGSVVGSGAGELPRYPVGIAAITSCTNTSDPRLLITAGLLARRARALGLSVPAWMKTSMAPGSPATTRYLARAGLDEDLSALGFDIVGFGCTTCIGNSGPLTEPIADVLSSKHPVAVLSGNRNFPGRVHPDLDLGVLVSPPLVVAYAIAGDAERDLTREPVGRTPAGREVFLDELWPSPEEIAAAEALAADPSDYREAFAAAAANPLWHHIEPPSGELFEWSPASTILAPPPFADADAGSLLGAFTARPLLVLGDDVTTDHISPASAIPADSLAGRFLVERGEDPADLNVFASRRGQWEVMVRGGYYNKTLRNALAPDAPPGHTTHSPSGEVLTIWDAAQRYRAEGQPLVVVAGERYGMGSSRDWAAKVQQLLGVRAVLAAGFERIHRSNLIGMGILPLYVPAEQRERLAGLRPGDVIDVDAKVEAVGVGSPITVTVRTGASGGSGGSGCSDGSDGSGDLEGSEVSFEARAAVETPLEVELLRAGGVIPLILARHLP